MACPGASLHLFWTFCQYTLTCLQRYRGWSLNIRQKLFIALFLTAAIVVGALVVAQRIALERGIKNFARAEELTRANALADHLADQYSQTGDWSFLSDARRWPPTLLRAQMRHARLGMRDARPPPPQHARLPRPRPRAPWWTRTAVLDADGNRVAGAEPEAGSDRVPILLNAKTIGFVALTPLKDLEDELQIRFERKQARGIIAGGGLALAIASLGAALLARSFSRPIQALTDGANAVASGDYNARVASARRDELGQLAQSFNQMAAALEQARRARRQWVADIAHELRTPLSVLRGELEAIEDGVRQPDARALASLSEETRRLGNLVDDLHQLSLADAGALKLDITDVNVAEFLRDMMHAWSPRFRQQSLRLSVAPTEPGITLAMDRDRMRQLVDNLLENSLRYSDAGGQCRVCVTLLENGWELLVEDTGPGVPDAALPRLFDRLYRVDPSRTRATGASGLGLAIVRSIADAHCASVDARHSDLGGLAIVVRHEARSAQDGAS